MDNHHRSHRAYRVRSGSIKRHKPHVFLLVSTITAPPPPPLPPRLLRLQRGVPPAPSSRASPPSAPRRLSSQRGRPAAVTASQTVSGSVAETRQSVLVERSETASFAASPRCRCRSSFPYHIPGRSPLSLPGIGQINSKPTSMVLVLSFNIQNQTRLLCRIKSVQKIKTKVEASLS